MSSQAAQCRCWGRIVKQLASTSRGSVYCSASNLPCMQSARRSQGKAALFTFGVCPGVCCSASSWRCTRSACRSREVTSMGSHHP